MELHNKDKIRLLITLQNLHSALFFYSAKMILDRSNNFGCVQFGLDMYNFGRVQKFSNRLKLDFARLVFIIGTRPKKIGPIQNFFGSIEEQGIGFKNATIS